MRFYSSKDGDLFVTLKPFPYNLCFGSDVIVDIPEDIKGYRPVTIIWTYTSDKRGLHGAGNHGSSKVMEIFYYKDIDGYYKLAKGKKSFTFTAEYNGTSSDSDYVYPVASVE